MIELAAFVLGFSMAACVGMGWLPGWLGIVAALLASFALGAMGAPSGRRRRRRRPR